MQNDGARRSRDTSRSGGGIRYTPYSLPHLQVSPMSLSARPHSGTAEGLASALSAAADVSLSSADCVISHQDRYYSTPPSTPLSAASSGTFSSGSSPSGLHFTSQNQSSVESLALDDAYSGLAQPFAKDSSQFGAFYPIPFAPHAIDTADATSSALPCFDDDYSTQFAWIMN